MKRFILIGIRTELEWQLAYQAAQHAEGGRRNYLTYETPTGDVTLSVERRGNDVTVRRNGNA
jgi:hypothetical protein